MSDGGRIFLSIIMLNFDSRRQTSVFSQGYDVGSEREHSFCGTAISHSPSWLQGAALGSLSDSTGAAELSRVQVPAGTALIAVQSWGCDMLCSAGHLILIQRTLVFFVCLFIGIFADISFSPFSLNRENQPPKHFNDIG